MKKYTSKHVALLGATAITLALMPVSGVAQQAMTVTPQPNTEPDSAPVGNSSGFVFAVDGVPVNADPVIEDRIRRTDIALAILTVTGCILVGFVDGLAGYLKGILTATVITFRGFDDFFVTGVGCGTTFYAGHISISS